MPVHARPNTKPQWAGCGLCFMGGYIFCKTWARYRQELGPITKSTERSLKKSPAHTPVHPKMKPGPTPKPAEDPNQMLPSLCLQGVDCKAPAYIKWMERERERQKDGRLGSCCDSSGAVCDNVAGTPVSVAGTKGCVEPQWHRKRNFVVLLEFEWVYSFLVEL